MKQVLSKSKELQPNCPDLPKRDLIIVRLEKCHKTKFDRYLLYELYQYEITSNQSCNYDIIEPKSIFRPAIIIPCPDRSNNYKIFKRSEASTIRFWIIPYKKVTQQLRFLSQSDEIEFISSRIVEFDSIE